jgi:TrmH family RNA methyltransferase
LQTVTLGKHNPRLLDIRRAVEGGTVTDGGLLPIEGSKLLAEAERSGLEIGAIFVRRGVTPPAVASGVPVYELDAAAFKTIQSTETSQGLVALVRPRRFSLVDILKRRKPLVIVMARLQDPGNTGTILRVAESFGADGCLATAGTASSLNAKTVRASAGSVFRMPHVWDLEFGQTVAALKESGIRVIGTAPAAEQTIDTWDWTAPSAIVIGNEGSGLSESEMQSCDAVLRIPCSSLVESLNSAIAAAVVLYEAAKQRRASGKDRR